MPGLSPGVPSSSPLAPWPMNSGIVGVPAVPMISSFACSTYCRRLSGVGYSGLTPRPGYAEDVDDRRGLHLVPYLGAVGAEERREIELECARDAHEMGLVNLFEVQWE